MLLVLGLGSEVKKLDVSLEIIGLSVHGLEHVWGDEFFVIEFSDFLLWVEGKCIVVIPLSSIDLLE